jgi:ABC-type transporter Mla maintaining outer membrane lipid asymmetry ATPase subunit MlaF
MIEAGGFAAGRYSRVMQRAPAIVADSLTRRFGERLAVDALSFDVATGEIFGFLGRTGLARARRSGCANYK